MTIPARVKRSAGRYALVDGIPFRLPVDSSDTPALMAAFTIDADRAAGMLPGNELHPVRLPGGRGLLVITVVDYQTTDIGKYIEFSIALACMRGSRPLPLPLALALGRVGQFVLDLPVSSEVSVKGGKGIWGMPKHQAYLEFEITKKHVASRYYLDGELAVSIEVKRPWFVGLPVAAAAANYCQFRGMLMKSNIHFRGRGGLRPPFTRSARLEISDHPRVAPLKTLEPGEKPLFSAFFPETRGTLDDHFESWFLSYDEPPSTQPEGLESVADLGLSEEWLPRRARALEAQR
ncbi:MAG TPA: acetoacetate decarboxylase family protein [Solirubrobacteraceae bacterium]|nr:acetoacetate decarboxylase family protein [Solirubrobacteraceae bacterium]